MGNTFTSKPSLTIAQSSPEPPLNWCDMPPEIKAECIKKCDIKERLNLRSTAHTERLLVDSQKSEIPLLRAEIGTYQSTISTGAHILEMSNMLFPNTNNHPAPCLEHLLKTSSNIAIFQLLSTPWTSITRQFADKEFKLNVEIFQHDSCCRRDLLFYLNALDSKKIQWIQMNWEDEGDLPTIDEIVKIPSVINCGFWQISNYDNTDSAVKVAQAWIGMDARIGLTFQVLSLEYGTLEDFIIEFEDRLVFNSPNLVRIAMDDPKKHIMLELGHHALEAEQIMGGLFFKHLQFLRLLTVSADAPNSDEEEWIQTVTWMNYLSPGYEFPDVKRDLPYDVLNF